MKQRNLTRPRNRMASEQTGEAVGKFLALVCKVSELPFRGFDHEANKLNELIPEQKSPLFKHGQIVFSNGDRIDPVRKRKIYRCGAKPCTNKTMHKYSIKAEELDSKVIAEIKKIFLPKHYEKNLLEEYTEKEAFWTRELPNKKGAKKLEEKFKLSFISFLVYGRKVLKKNPKNLKTNQFKKLKRKFTDFMCDFMGYLIKFIYLNNIIQFLGKIRTDIIASCIEKIVINDEDFSINHIKFDHNTHLFMFHITKKYGHCFNTKIIKGYDEYRSKSYWEALQEVYFNKKNMEEMLDELFSRQPLRQYYDGILKKDEYRFGKNFFSKANMQPFLKALIATYEYWEGRRIEDFKNN